MKPLNVPIHWVLSFNPQSFRVFRAKLTRVYNISQSARGVAAGWRVSSVGRARDSW